MKRLFNWLIGGERRRLEAQVAKFRRDQAARNERQRREAGIPEGVELLPNGSIADPDIQLRWLIGRMVASGNTTLNLTRPGLSRLPDELAQLVPTVRKLKVWDQTQSVFDGIGVLGNLEEIDLVADAVKDLSPLANCPRLRSLKIGRAGEDELASLPDLPELEQLTVKGGSVAGLSASLPKLHLLDLTSCYNVPRDILLGKPVLAVTRLPDTGDEPLPSSDPTCMRELTRMTDALDLSDIGAMTGLTSLQLEATEATDLSPLSALKNLTYLHLRAPKAASFAPFEGLSALERLIIPSWRDEKALPDLSWVRGCPVLADLRISISKDADLTDLTHLPRLERLHLGFSEPTDLSPLGSLTSVKRLMLRASTPEASARNLALPGRLTSLSLKGRTFTSLDMLATTPHLTRISLDDCGVTDLSALETQTELTSLSLIRSDITDLSVLRHLPAFNVEATKAHLYIHEGAVLDAYPSLRPYIDSANDREPGVNAMPNLVRAAVALAS
ncbi:leucine-rich repeat domain-containing protein [Antarcticimicrobium sediminis]|uniref:Leucine-rich repeat domain-containing protein n=1 Tax=Antarcticimicrobium sediminis TaxID=2546227 RepID=A0A4R5EHT1_9RHOB|nr:leucine-rich repeat domain-containing protein [Antarcticimicrobium sediminis]TDE33833.1 leucine-rich repeat domain-containing protein [Antarcticimicrobium sediminis]